MIRIFRASIGNYRVEMERAKGAGWRVLSVKQSKIFGIECNGIWIGDWIIKCAPKSLFDSLPDNKKIQLILGERCSQSEISLRSLMTEFFITSRESISQRQKNLKF